MVLLFHSLFRAGKREFARRVLSTFVDNLALSWFRSYLNDRKQRCFLNGRLSSSSSISKGIPQGSIMFKTLNGQTPQYLQDMFNSRRCQYSLRNSNGKLFIPKLKRSFSYSGAFLWNNLSESLRLSPSFTSFKSSLESLYSSRTDSHTATR